MGSKINYIERMNHCKDWVIWVTPREYRLLRLRGVEIPIGISFANKNVYIFNGEYSFSMTNTRYGMYNCSKFRSEATIFDRMVFTVGKKTCSDVGYWRTEVYQRFLSFEGSKEEMRTLALTSSIQYDDFCKSEIPSLFLWGAEENKVHCGAGEAVWYRPKTASKKSKWTYVSLEPIKEGDFYKVTMTDIIRL